MFRRCVFFLLLSPLLFSSLTASLKDEKNCLKIAVVNRDKILKTLVVINRMTDYLHDLRDKYKKELSDKEGTLYAKKRELDQKLGHNLPKPDLDQAYLSLESEIKALRLQSIGYKNILSKLEDFIMEKVQHSFKEAINHLQKKLKYHLVLYQSHIAYFDDTFLEDITESIIIIMNSSIKIESFDKIMSDLRKKEGI